MENEENKYKITCLTKDRDDFDRKYKSQLGKNITMVKNLDRMKVQYRICSNEVNRLNQIITSLNKSMLEYNNLEYKLKFILEIIILKYGLI